jgi:hypothetical protein
MYSMMQTRHSMRTVRDPIDSDGEPFGDAALLYLERLGSAITCCGGRRLALVTLRLHFRGARKFVGARAVQQGTRLGKAR